MDAAGDEELRRLGARLRAFRIANGLSQRALVKRIGLSAHSNLTDYELGRRLPPSDVIVACEQVLDVRGGELRRLRDAVLVARAGAPGSPWNRDPSFDVVPVRASGGAAVSDTDVVDSAMPSAGRSRIGRMRRIGGIGRIGRIAILRFSAATATAAVASGALLLTVTSDSSSHHGSPPLVLAAGSAMTHVSNCDDGAVVLENDVVDGPLPATAGRPPQQAVGELALRYSPSCALAWARFLPGAAAADMSGTVVLSVHRRDDGATSALSLARVDSAESDPLLTVPGCVYAQVTIAFASGPPVTAHTSCRQG
ncbi:MAG: helix-turn-helix domain-containing protein [Acidothermaceae bacterium]